MNFKNLIYIAAGVSFSIVIGAAVYEHMAVWPRAFKAVPASLTMLQGEYGLNAEVFWKTIHPVTLLLLITTLVMSWKTSRKMNVLATLIGYVIILGITFTYFVPELLSITQTAYADTVDASLTKRGGTWTTLSIVRLFTLIGLAINYFLGLTKSND
ncbi:MAG: hypothetical protein H7Y42_01505 [Chitinophagaceae bacterium]|nr:hypothetical protein [Chitinophagaceae bacterium]